jgi:hypothetical protein
VKEQEVVPAAQKGRMAVVKEMAGEGMVMMVEVRARRVGQRVNANN